MTESYGTITITDTTDLEWFYGTILDGTGDATDHQITLTTDLVTGAAVGSMYLNTQTSLVYKCVAASDTSQTWQYVGNMASGVQVGGKNMLTGTNVITTLASTGTWADKTWCEAGSGTGTITSINITDAPDKSITVGWNFAVTSVSSQNYGSSVAIGQNGVKLVPNKQYTISCYAKGTGKLYMFYGISSFAPTDNSGKIDVSSEWEKYSITFTTPASNTNIVSSTGANVFFGASGNDITLQICGMKLEEGNVATAWSPAPEDVDLAIDSIEIGRNLLFDTDAPSLTKVAAGSDRYWSSNASLSTHGTAEFISLTDSPCQARNGIQLNSTQDTATITHGLAFYKTSGTSQVSFEVGQTYTISCYVKVVSGTVKQCQFNIQNGSTIGFSSFRFIPTSEWKRYYVTFTASANMSQKNVYFEMAYTSIGAVQMCGFKLEKGKKATTWVPAPEDTDNKISNANTTALQALASANGKNTVYYATEEDGPPTDGTYQDGDTWFKLDSNGNTIEILNWDQSQNNWVSTQLGQNTIMANAIKARHITVGAIDASKIAANTITANQIAAGTITANKIDVNNLFAQDITATNLKLTDSTSAYMTKVDSDGINFFRNASGEYQKINTISANAITVYEEGFSFIHKWTYDDENYTENIFTIGTSSEGDALEFSPSQGCDFSSGARFHFPVYFDSIPWLNYGGGVYQISTFYFSGNVVSCDGVRASGDLTTSKTQVEFFIPLLKSPISTTLKATLSGQWSIRHADGGYILNNAALTSVGTVTTSVKELGVLVVLTLTNASSFTNNCPVVVSGNSNATITFSN